VLQGESWSVLPSSKAAAAAEAEAAEAAEAAQRRAVEAERVAELDRMMTGLAGGGGKK
jgi:hypothetical protein